MRQNRLLNLLARNRGKGEFRAETTDAGNTIYLYDQIVATEEDAYWMGGVAADTFVKALLAMDGPVMLRINSPGGDVFASRAMAQAIREYSGMVTAHVDGYAASAASFLTSVADRTVMAPGSMLMIHKAWSFAMGNSDDFAASASLLAKIDGTIAATYAASAEKRGKNPSDFIALMAAETWLTDEEAIELGLADETAPSVDKAADKSATASARARWDITAYTHAPAHQRQDTLDQPLDTPPAREAEVALLAATATAKSESERRRRMATALHVTV